MPVDVSQLVELGATLRSANGRVGRDAAKVVRDTTKKVEAEAKTRVHVRTGILRSSITSSVSGSGHGGAITGLVTAGADYAAYQEYGTSHNPPVPAVNDAADSQEGPFASSLEALAARLLESS